LLVDVDVSEYHVASIFRVTKASSSKTPLSTHDPMWCQNPEYLSPSLFYLVFYIDLISVLSFVLTANTLGLHHLQNNLCTYYKYYCQFYPVVGPLACHLNSWSILKIAAIFFMYKIVKQTISFCSILSKVQEKIKRSMGSSPLICTNLQSAPDTLVSPSSWETMLKHPFLKI
jgi:hypothetical protein